MLNSKGTESKYGLKLDILNASGIIGSYVGESVFAETTIRLEVMDVGSSFVMDVEGQIKNSPNWYVVTTVTGAITGTLDISTYDRIRYRIITPSGVGTLIASGYITNTSSGGVSVEYKALIDSVSSNLTYIGEAPIGSNQASSIWRIQRIQTSGSIVAIEFADSNANFDNIWNNRALLSYG